jgi:uncharacterized protein YqgQ
LSIRESTRGITDYLTSGATVKGSAGTLLSGITPVFSLLSQAPSNSVSDSVASLMPGKPHEQLRYRNNNRNDNFKKSTIEKSRYDKLQRTQNDQARSLKSLHSVASQSLNLQKDQFKQTKLLAKNSTEQLSITQKTFGILKKSFPFILAGLTLYAAKRDSKLISGINKVLDSKLKGLKDVPILGNFTEGVRNKLKTTGAYSKSTTSDFYKNILKQYTKVYLSNYLSPKVSGWMDLSDTLKNLSLPTSVYNYGSGKYEKYRRAFNGKRYGELDSLKDKLESIKNNSIHSERGINRLYDLWEGTELSRRTYIRNKYVSPWRKSRYLKQQKEEFVKNFNPNESGSWNAKITESNTKFLSEVFSNRGEDTYNNFVKTIKDPTVKQQMTDYIKKVQRDTREDPSPSEIMKHFIVFSQGKTFSTVFETQSKTIRQYSGYMTKFFNNKDLSGGLYRLATNADNPLIRSLVGNVVKKNMPLSGSEKIKESAINFLAKRYPVIRPFVKLSAINKTKSGLGIKGTLFNRKNVDKYSNLAYKEYAKMVGHQIATIKNRSQELDEMYKKDLISKEDYTQEKSDLAKERKYNIDHLHEIKKDNTFKGLYSTAKDIYSSPVMQNLVDDWAKTNRWEATLLQLNTKGVASAAKTLFASTDIGSKILKPFKAARTIYRLGAKGVPEAVKRFGQLLPKDLRKRAAEVEASKELAVKEKANPGSVTTEMKAQLVEDKKAALENKSLFKTALKHPIQAAKAVWNSTLGGALSGLLRTFLGFSISKFPQQSWSLLENLQGMGLELLGGLGKATVKGLDKVEEGLNPVTKTLVNIYSDISVIKDSLLKKFGFKDKPKSIEKEESSEEETSGEMEQFAIGGIVKKPTKAIIGEHNHPEAILPMNNDGRLRHILTEAEKTKPGFLSRLHSHTMGAIKGSSLYHSITHPIETIKGSSLYHNITHPIETIKGSIFHKSQSSSGINQFVSAFGKVDKLNLKIPKNINTTDRYLAIISGTLLNMAKSGGGKKGGGFLSLIKKVTGIAKNIVSGLGGLLAGLAGGILPKMLGKLKGIGGSIFNKIGSIFKGGGGSAAEGVGADAAEGVGTDVAAGVGTDVAAGALGVETTAGLADAWNPVGWVLLAGAAATAVYVYRKQIGHAIGYAWKGIKHFASSAYKVVSHVSSDIWKGTKTVAKDVWKGIKTVASDTWKGIKTIATDELNGIKTIASGVANSIKYTGKFLLNDIAKPTIHGVETVAKGGWKALETIGSDAQQLFEKSIGSNKTKVTNSFMGLSKSEFQQLMYNSVKMGIYDGMKSFYMELNKAHGNPSNVPNINNNKPSNPGLPGSNNNKPWYANMSNGLENDWNKFKSIF